MKIFYFFIKYSQNDQIVIKTFRRMNTEFSFLWTTVAWKHKRRNHGILGDCIKITIFYIFELTIMHYMHTNVTLDHIDCLYDKITFVQFFRCVYINYACIMLMLCL